MEKIKRIINYVVSERFLNLLVLLVISAFLMTYFKPELMLSKTTTTGGDTASHYYSAYFMKNNLLPNAKVSGWTQGNYAGFPMFQFYFFLPFLVIALLGYLIPLQIAFKIVSVLGIFLLPITAYISTKAMKFRYPTPILSSIFTLPFLFMEANSMWGGNIPSTLAGEFSYSISLSLTVLYLGLLYREIHREQKKRHLTLVFLLVLMTFTHVYTLLFAVAASSFFLFTNSREKLVKNIGFLFKIYVLSFFLVSFWAIPMVWKLSYTTPFAVVWHINGLKEIFPIILQPLYLLAAAGFIIAVIKADRRVGYLSFSLLAAYVLYLISPKLDIVDIRFIPFIQLFPIFISAYAVGEVVKKLEGKRLIPFIALIATILWVGHNVTFIPNWIDWNYQGFEKKAVWNDYSGVNEFLKGSENRPRVVYEHSPLHNSAGSSRAFESLSLFSGRSTLEGLYMQSSISAPFIFYIQSEISKETSCPFPQWPCTSFNPDNAAKHLQMFNVNQVIARTETVKTALKANPKYSFQAAFGPYEVYGLTTNNNRYVIIPKYEPVLFNTDRWKEASYLWFINPSVLDIPLVFEKENIKDFKVMNTDGQIDNLPKIPVERQCTIDEQISHNEILINTTCPGAPHIIRVSYFPNWKVDGAKAIYLVSPSFMLIYPTQEKVRLYYGRTFIDEAGLLLTLLGMAMLLFERRLTKRIALFFPVSKGLEAIDAMNKFRALILIVAIVTTLGVYTITQSSRADAQLKKDIFGKELAVASARYTVCDTRIEDTSIREACFKEVAIMTDDFNLCEVRIMNQSLRDECLKEIAIKTGNLNLCSSKIKSEELKTQCIESLKEMNS